MSQNSEGSDIFKLIPLFLVWAVAYIIDSMRKPKRPKSNRNKREPIEDVIYQKKSQDIQMSWNELDIIDDIVVDEVFPPKEIEPRHTQVSEHVFISQFDMPSAPSFVEKVIKKRHTFSSKKQMMIAHEVLSPPVAFRKSIL